MTGPGLHRKPDVHACRPPGWLYQLIWRVVPGDAWVCRTCKRRWLLYTVFDAEDETVWLPDDRPPEKALLLL